MFQQDVTCSGGDEAVETRGKVRIRQELTFQYLWNGKWMERKQE